MNYRIIEPNELDYNKFEAVARLIELNSFGAITTNVEVVYLDVGQDWLWTTIVAYNKNDNRKNWQMLSPKNWKDIMSADPSELNNIAMEIVEKQSHLF